MGTQSRESVSGLVPQPDSGAPVPHSDSPPAQLPSWLPAQPRKGGEQQEEFALLGKCILASASVGHITHPPTFLIQWDFFQLEGGQNDEEGGRLQSLLVLEMQPFISGAKRATVY